MNKRTNKIVLKRGNTYGHMKNPQLHYLAEKYKLI